LARPHPHAAAVDRRVGAPSDDRRPAVGDLDPVAVAPDAREGGEVALAIARPVLIAPEIERHRRHRLGEHELPDLVDERTTVLTPRLDLRPERPRLELASVDRQRRDAADERRADIGPARGGEEPDVLTELLAHPVE